MRSNTNQQRPYRPAPFAAAYIAMVLLGVTGALLAYLALHQLDPTAGRLDVAKTALAVVAGSGAGAALYVSYRKQRTEEVNSILAQANSEREQDKLFTERYTTAVEQLGNANAAVRLGGVTALARIADDSERDRPTCLTLLCTYLRIPYDPATNPDELHVRDTIQSELTKRLHESYPGFWRDADINLTGANLHNVNFDGCTIGSAEFSEATFSGPAGFTAAKFSGRAGFGKASFSDSAWFDETTFSGRAWFAKAAFSDDAWFGRATFSDPVSFAEATFSDDAHFANATFSYEARFARAKFSGEAQFDNAAFFGPARFAEAMFSDEAWFVKTTFSDKAQFDEATFSEEAWFDEATFSDKAQFAKATFSYTARFDEATFSDKAQFDEATFSRPAGFAKTTFSDEAQFAKTTFSGQAQFDEATFSDKARFDEATFSGLTSFSRASFKGLASFIGVDFGEKVVTFENPREWPAAPEFDWNSNIAMKPANIEPQEWPPKPEGNAHLGIPSID